MYLSYFCCVPCYSIVSCGSTYVSAVYLTPVATILSAVALLITFIICTSLRWIQYCELWLYLSCFCTVPHSGGYSIVSCGPLLVTFMICNPYCQQLWLYLSFSCSVPHSGDYNIVSYCSTYHIYDLYFTPVAAILPEVALLIMFL